MHACVQVPLKMKTTITMGPADGVHVSRLLCYSAMSPIRFNCAQAGLHGGCLSVPPAYLTDVHQMLRDLIATENVGVLSSLAMLRS